MASELASLDQVCSARIHVRDMIGQSLFAGIEREFNKCTAQVLAHSRMDAWQYAGTEQDTAAHR
eukprot:12428325-Karenia_brevis.AAC.1